MPKWTKVTACLLLACLCVALFVACDGVATGGHTHTFNKWIVVKTPTKQADGQIKSTCTQCKQQVTKAISLEKYDGLRYVNVVGINDLHGETDKMARISGYMSTFSNGVLICSGDMFQGTFASNVNYGQLLSQCMEQAHFDAFTIGNHEFDWGISRLTTLSQQSATPFLGANIYHWDNSTNSWGDFCGEFAQEYVIKTLENGIKVGVIGVIGKQQLKSIQSQIVQNVGFKDPAEVIPALSDKLRNQLGCNVVVVSAHTDQDDFVDNKNFDITQYADAVFCAHSHQNETHYKNGVPFVQAGANGSHVGVAKILVDDDNAVVCAPNNHNTVEYSYLWRANDAVEQLISNANEQIMSQANQVLATCDDYMNKNVAIPRLASRAIANYAINQGYDVVLGMVNAARAYFGNQTNVTYEQLYQALPFDNVVYVARVSGADIHKEAQYNGFWRVSDVAIENSNDKFYDVAVIDYVLFHQNLNRQYDYFPSAFCNGSPVALTDADGTISNYRNVTRNYLLQTKKVYSSDYSYENDCTDLDKLGEKINSKY